MSPSDFIFYCTVHRWKVRLCLELLFPVTKPPRECMVSCHVLSCPFLSNPERWLLGRSRTCPELDDVCHTYFSVLIRRCKSPCGSVRNQKIKRNKKKWMSDGRCGKCLSMALPFGHICYVITMLLMVVIIVHLVIGDMNYVGGCGGVPRSCLLSFFATAKWHVFNK